MEAKKTKRSKLDETLERLTADIKFITERLKIFQYGLESLEERVTELEDAEQALSYLSEDDEEDGCPF